MTLKSKVICLVIAILLGLAIILASSLGRDRLLVDEAQSPGFTYISNGEDLEAVLSESVQYLALSQDLDVFADKGLGAGPTTEDHTNVFTIKSGVSEKDEVISFKGGYENPGVVVLVTIKQLKNNRLSVSITGAKDNTNIDSQLPSNSKKNKFIATLPIVNQDYGIYYYSDTDKISIEVFGEYTAEKRDAALNELRINIGKTLTEQDYDLYYTPPSVEGAGSSGLLEDGDIVQ